MVSFAFCRALIESESESMEIVVIGEEPRVAYDRVNLTSFFTSGSPDHLSLTTRDWYEQHGIALYTGRRVDAIDRSARCVVLDDGERLTYDQLVLATGSRPFVPRIPGTDLDGVFVYRTIEDVEAIRKYTAGRKIAAVMGGGLLGLEAAKAMQDMNMVAHVVEMAPALMPRQLDRECSETLLEQIEAKGVTTHLPKRTEAIERHGDFLMLRFDTGDSLAAEIVIISAGIRPRDELARTAGLKVAERGGIIVNDRLQTSDERIYAIGECASHDGIVYGLLAPCVQMAHVLAGRLAGGDHVFVRGDRSASLKLLGIDVTSVGEPLEESVGSEVIPGPKSKSHCRRLLVRGGRVVGAIGVGPWPEVDRIRDMISREKRVGFRALRRFRMQGELWALSTSSARDWPPESIICSCRRVTRREITTAFEQGCNTIEAIAEKTGACATCRSCEPLVADLIGEQARTKGQSVGALGLLIASIAALVVLFAAFWIGPVSFSRSVASSRYALDALWRDEVWKQISGYSLLAITVLATLLTLRKRWKISLGAFGTWRMAHAFLGLASLIGVAVHTGFHLGENANFWLAACFLGLNGVGAVTGMAASMESRVDQWLARSLRAWRPRFALLHILMFWPLPVLIVVHVFCVYFY